jgi:hypothetical protein
MTKHAKLRLLILFLSAFALTAAYHHIKTETAMVETAKNFLASLTPEQRAKAVNTFGAESRTHWHFVPDANYEKLYGHERRGLLYKQLTSPQQRLADALLSAGLSKSGFVKASTIMSLEDILRILEKDNPPGRRDPERYYIGFFGEPSATGSWGWSLEGHHVSLNFTLKDGKLVGSSPTFFGANPHEVREGPRAGLRVLGSEEDVARNLMKSLDAGQQKQALIEEKAPSDIVTAASIRAKLEGDPQGLLASKMNAKQFEALQDLIAVYAHNLPEDMAARRLEAVKATPRDKIHFAWAGGVEKGVGDYYRVQGPTFLIEYNNTQGRNNHSHTVWRDFQGDFGFDVLAMHHRLFDHGLGTVRAD